jgi:hypothetical protein
LTSFSMEERNCKSISKSTNHEQINKYKWKSNFSQG